MAHGSRARLVRRAVGSIVLLLFVASQIAVGTAGAVPTPAGPQDAHAAIQGGNGGVFPASGYPTHLVPNSSVANNSTLGYFDGYWYDSTLNVTTKDGLNKTELRAYVDRTMARDELVLHRNFESDVPVSFVSRANYTAEQNGSAPVNATHSRWNNDVWRASFIVGHDGNITKILGQYYGGHVEGYYDPSTDSIVLVTPTGSSGYIDPPTLAHELVHAMQDQYYNLSRPMYGGRTQDQQMGVHSLLEGQADYTRDVYQHECSIGQWNCLSRNSGGSSGGGSSSGQLNYGVQWVVYFPYANGPGYVDSLVQRSGWNAVYDQFAHPPQTSATVIHHRSIPGRTITVHDTATNGWQRYHGVGVNGTDSVGEGTIYSMFWWQSYRYGAGVVSPGSIQQGSSPFDDFNYTSAPSAGWAGDRVIPYHNPSASTDGYVWVTEWQTTADARQFVSAYQKVLDAHQATASGSTWRVPASDSYAGTYRIVENGTRVTIVEGPTRTAVDQIRPNLASRGTTVPPTSTAGPSTTGTPSTGTSTTSAVPGLGVAGALLALLLAIGLGVGRK